MKQLQHYWRASINLVLFTTFKILVRGYAYGGGNQVLENNYSVR